MIVLTEIRSGKHSKEWVTTDAVGQQFSVVCAGDTLHLGPAYSGCGDPTAIVIDKPLALGLVLAFENFIKFGSPVL